MAIPTLYKWDDAGAPQLTRQAQSLLTILRKCLVDGYGSKAAMGWSIAFDDAVNLRTVYRNASGTGEIRFAPASTPAGDNVAFLAATSFSDIDNALAPGLGDLALTYFVPHEYNRWAVVGTADSAYLLVWASSITVTNAIYTTRHQAYFFGNMISPVNDDPHPFVAIGRMTPAATNSAIPPSYSAGAALSAFANGFASFSTAQQFVSTYISGSINGAISRRIVNVITGVQRTPVTVGTSALYSTSHPMLVPQIPLMLAELATTDSPPTDKSAAPLIRGALPGVVPLAFWFNAINGEVVDVGGTPHVAIQSSYSHGCCLLITLGDWWAT